jgi:hypothetical protein
MTDDVHVCDRMIKGVVNSLSLLCVALCCVLCACWIAGDLGFVCPVWKERHPVTTTRFSLGVHRAPDSNRTVLTLARIRPFVDRQTGVLHDRPVYSRRTWFGIDFVDGVAGVPATERAPSKVYLGIYDAIAFPIWYAIIALSIIPACRLAGRMFQRVRRIKRGCCIACGYDLRGSPQQCPECGTLPAARSSTRTSTAVRSSM